MPRGDEGHSILVHAEACAPHLLHYDPEHGWSLEALPASAEPPETMWPDERGGLWVRVGDALLYRDTDARWHDVAPPESWSPGRQLDVANVMFSNDLLVMVGEPGLRVVFATQGPVDSEM
ncbi:hypothetical protein [Enhygromyxa salina]|uniref:hypothetical protein n=1 Tax=Enhygromyxa salina TaxID=215803 RepID=UPI0011BA9C57|nr:hypothetical protein [Enhygromyxa salina]